jgi:hypothetical protein
MLKITSRLLAVAGILIGCLLSAANACPKGEPGVHNDRMTIANREDHKAGDHSEIRTVSAVEPAPVIRASLEIGHAAPASAEPTTQLKEDKGSPCLRPSCGCTPNTHGRNHCYRTRGDCPTHPGILCLWE